MRRKFNSRLLQLSKCFMIHNLKIFKRDSKLNFHPIFAQTKIFRRILKKKKFSLQNKYFSKKKTHIFGHPINYWTNIFISWIKQFKILFPWPWFHFNLHRLFQPFRWMKIQFAKERLRHLNTYKFAVDYKNVKFDDDENVCMEKRAVQEETDCITRHGNLNWILYRIFISSFFLSLSLSFYSDIKWKIMFTVLKVCLENTHSIINVYV